MHTTCGERTATEPRRFAGRARRVATGIAWAMLLCAPRAFAQSPVPPAPEAPASPEVDPAVTPAVAEARAAFQGGIALAKAERWAPALEAFERSEALHPHAVTMYNIGYCELQMRHWTLARKKLAQALADHRARGEVELPDGLVSAAKKYLSDTDRQIARVVVSITGGAVTVDGRPLELAESGGPRPVMLAGTRAAGTPEVPPSVTFEVLADPGAHVFVLFVNGQASASVNETLAPGVTSTLSLAVPEPRADSQAPPPPQPEKVPNHVPAFVAFGVGAAGLAVGTVSGLVAFGKKDDVDGACQGTDTSACSSELDSGNRAADIATVSFIVGGAGIAVGTLLWLFAPDTATSKVAKATAIKPGIRPVLAWPAVGVQGYF